METNINLYGASGHCKVIIDILLDSNNVIDAIYDDDLKKTALLHFSIKHTSQIDLSKNNNFILSVGNNQIRNNLAKKLKVNFVNATHSKASISRFSTVDVGTVIMANAVVNADAKIGKHCIINTGAIIEHDCLLDDFVHVCPNASLAGGVVVGVGSQIGIGAIIKQEIKIGKWVTIGAGCVVLNNVPDYAIMVGNPARILKYNQVENE